MAHEVTAALITGVCTLAVGFFGGKALYNNISININGQEIPIDKQNYKKLYSDLEKENEELKMQLARKDTESQQSEQDYVNNIRLVIDSTEVGNAYRGLADNGELLLSVSAISDYIGKSIMWDSSQNTVFIGNSDSKVAKKVDLWNKPYLDFEHLETLYSNEEEHIIGTVFWHNDHVPSTIENNVKVKENYITYALDGKATLVSGILGIDTEEEDSQLQFEFTDQNDSVLYTSPKLTRLSPSVEFSVNTTNVLILKINIKMWSRRDLKERAYIQNLSMTTTDY